MMPTYKTFIEADVLMLLLPAAIGGWLTHVKPVSAHFVRWIGVRDFGKLRVCESNPLVAQPTEMEANSTHFSVLRVC